MFVMRSVYLAAGLAVLATAPAAAQAIVPAPLKQAEVTFAMRATKVNDFIGRVDSVQARFGGNDLSNASGSVEFRVRDMHTGIGLRDTHMRNAMKADSFPTIRFELVGFISGASQADTLHGVFQGHLTIHGVTQTVRVPGYVLIRGNNTEVYASQPVDMREYGIEPPVRFLGAVRVEPVTIITTRLVFGP